MTPRFGAKRLMADLSGRSSRAMLSSVADQASLAVEGARLAEQLALGQVTTGDATRAMTAIEHSGDDHRASLVVMLGRSLSTPIDREDLYRLSLSVDDALDNLRDYVRESELYQLNDQRCHAACLTHIGDGMHEMHGAIMAVASAPATVAGLAVTVRRHAGAVRRLYQQEMASLLTGTVTTDMLQHRELLHRIDDIALRMAEAANALTDGVLKRSH